MLPSGVHFKDHAEEMRLLRTGPQRAALALLVLLLAAFPFFASTYVVGLAITVAITVIAVAGLQITVGMAGLLNLGQSAFVGVGAFTAAALYANYNVPMLPAIALAGLASGLVSIVFSLPAIRIRGLYLALTTIAAQVVFPIVVLRLPTAWFGGSAGIGLDRVQIFGVAVEIDRGACPALPIFGIMQRLGNVSDREMFRTFNMGIGMIVITGPDAVQEMKERLGSLYEIGRVVSGSRSVEII